ncbi:uncharacterized protein LOC132043990 [Lycium ferocissimum]|uniref:uncharacterized protein LOC132043990 n=1 Tax=Lycium ferocissimum TaxID=112874 RepID=UPI0028159BB7|nr:uncharacterized protein LOC132043990 [Lycium ferocissimum]
MAKAYTQDDFDELMGKVQKVDMRVAEYFESAGRDKWARLYVSVNRGWTMTSNIAECINRHLLVARELPIYDFLEEVRRMFGIWNYNNRRNGTYTFTTLGKKFQEMLSINEYLCLRMTMKSPACTGVIKKKNLVADDYCSNLFKLETVLKTYDVPVDPLPDEREWNIPKNILEDVVLSPRYKRPPGRPKKRRDKPLSELLFGKSRHACSTCGQLGHNRRSCSFEPLRK